MGVRPGGFKVWTHRKVLPVRAKTGGTWKTLTLPFAKAFFAAAF
jgi:hypothetical protein